MKKRTKQFIKLVMKIISVVMTSAILYALMSLSQIYYTSGDTPIVSKDVIITSHRGAAGYAPENSLTAVQFGLTSKADRIEIDIQQTKDSVLVLMHDKTLNRTTDCFGKINELTYSELLSCNFNIDGSNHERIPTLEETMNLVAGEKMLIIEIKQGGTYNINIERRTVNLIQKYDAYSWCTIHSFCDDVLETVHKLDPKIKLSKLLVFKGRIFPIILDFKLRFKSLEKYYYVDEFSVFYTFANKHLIDEVHKMGKKINAWTVNCPQKANKLIKLGIDGIITDFPNDILN